VAARASSSAFYHASSALALAAVTACGGQDSQPTLLLTDQQAPAGYPDGPITAVAPVDSPLTEARAQLGRRLFFDRRLSRTGQVACGSCHKQENAFSDPMSVSTGVDGRMGMRNAPALVNLAWDATFFWDGRAASLEEQVTKPIENPLEMDLALDDALTVVGADASYVRDFATAFGIGRPSLETLRQALASFVRTLVSGSSPYDKHLRGDDTAFGAAAQRGEALFLSDKAACSHCHPGGPLTNGGYFNNGTYVAGGDPGRQAITGLPGDLGKFKVPTLRNVAASAPYMHDGSVATLQDVIEQYARGGRGDPTTDPQIIPLSLSEGDKADLLAFLVALTDDHFLTDPRYEP
jgi:cytochrome c peroxidase